MAVLPTLDLKNKFNGTKKENESEPGNENVPGYNRIAQGKVILSWSAPEYIIYKKNTLWYICFGVILAFLIFISLLMGSFLTAIVFVLAGILIYVYSERQPKTVNYDVRTSGIRIGNRIYLFRELAGFNIMERNHEVYILLKSKRIVMPLIHIPIKDQDPEEVLNVLGEYLPEDPEINEPIADILAHWVGF